MKRAVFRHTIDCVVDILWILHFVFWGVDMGKKTTLLFSVAGNFSTHKEKRKQSGKLLPTVASGQRVQGLLTMTCLFYGWDMVLGVDF
jgi:hypothetical protein